MGSAIGRTAVKALTALIILGAGLILLPILFIALVAGLAGGGGGGEGLPTTRSFVSGERNADVNLVAVPISGLILGEEPDNSGSLFQAISITYGYRIQEELAELADDDSVDGVILEINSPGGTIFGSRAIADGIDAYREETGKPIYAFVSGISASGGVYSMAGADMIYADYGTQIGSIGVIFGPITTFDDVRAIDGGLLGGGVTTEGGITVEYFTAGRNKDFGNPYRPVTDEEREVIQAGLDDAYADFVAHVSEGRDIPAADIEKDLGANIFGDSQAESNGLIDGIANRDSTYELLAEAAGLTDGQTWRVDRIQTAAPGLLGALAGPVDALSGEAGTDGRISATAHLCTSRGVMLAYHGDPALLCTAG